MKTKILNEKGIVLAADLLKSGEVVAFPTETVYGLGAPIFEPSTIEKIFSIKGRARDNPLIAHIASFDDSTKIAQGLPPTFFQLAEAFFPGPLTLVVRKKPAVPSIVSAGLETIAIRMPNHPIATALIDAVGQPLVAPSANLSGRPSSTTAEHVIADFDGKIGAVLDGGPCLHGMESTVIDLCSFEQPTLLRYGALSKEQIEAVLQQEIAAYTKGPKSSPGMKYRHYAPQVPVHLFFNRDSFESHPQKNSLILSSSILPIPYFPLQAKSLYAHLRFADQNGYDEVLVLCENVNDATLLNRLEKITSESHHP
ncbi:MAG: threonylcarbamoyl-AMP synthase [Verrucomicrobia bacterium]|nr:threonylcarbamoyl-AMP synthase [Verrucomicrobiota bacterium]